MGFNLKQKDDLTDQQDRFCQEYIIDLNATQAAIRAGYAERSATAQASRLLTIDKVASRITELMSGRSKRTEINSDTILRELFRLATVDISQAFDSQGGLLPFNEMPEDVRRAISSIEVNEMFSGQGDQKTAIGLNKKLRFWDKTKSLELLGKHLKLFTDKVEISSVKHMSDAELIIEAKKLVKELDGSSND